MTGGLEHLSYEDRLQKLDLFSLEKTEKYLIDIYKYINISKAGVKRRVPDSFQWCTLKRQDKEQ